MNIYFLRRIDRKTNVGCQACFASLRCFVSKKKFEEKEKCFESLLMILNEWNHLKKFSKLEE